jgi:hypothetical protein
MWTRILLSLCLMNACTAPLWAQEGLNIIEDVEPKVEPMDPNFEPVIRAEKDIEQVEQSPASAPPPIQSIRYSAISMRYTGLEGQTLTHPGFKFGNATIHPIFELEYQYDDNIFGQGQNHIDDFIGHYMPGVGLKYKKDSFNFRGAYQAGFHDYFSDNAPDYFSHDVLMDLEYTDFFTKGTFAGIREAYTQTGNTGQLEDAFFLFTRVRNNSLTPRMGYDHGKHFVLADFNWSITDYLRDARRQDEYNTFSTNLIYRHRVTKQLEPYFKYSFMHVMAERQSNSFEQHTGLGGLIARISKQLTLDYSMGWRVVKDLNPREDYKDGFVFNFRLDYSPSKIMSMYALAGHELQQQVRTGGEKETYAEIGITVFPVERFAIGMLGRWVDEDRTVSQQTWQGGIRFGYLVTDYLEIYASYEYSERTFRVARLSDIEINQGSIGLRFKY